MTKEDYILAITKAATPKNFEVTNSYGINDVYHLYKGNISRKDFGMIIKEVNKRMAKVLSKGEEVILPHRMGKLELRKRETKTVIKNDKIKTNLVVDWRKTLDLWYEDESSYESRKLVRIECPEVYKLFYNRHMVNCPNISYFEFRTNRNMKHKIRDSIYRNETDALMLY